MGIQRVLKWSQWSSKGLEMVSMGLHGYSRGLEMVSMVFKGS
jgi:hypothetical protein